MSFLGINMKLRGWILTLIIIGLVITVIGYLATQPAPVKANKTANTITITIKNNIGIDQITVTNLNTGKTYKASIIDLPLSFNCTRGDYLKLNVTTLSGFQWNAWWFSPMDIYSNDNPALIAIDATNPFGNIINNNAVIMVPHTIIAPETPPPIFTPQPTPTPTRTPELIQ